MPVTEAEAQQAVATYRQAKHAKATATYAGWFSREHYRRKHAHPSAWRIAYVKLKQAREGWGEGDEARAPIPNFCDKSQPELRRVFWLLCLYFAKDARFIEANPSRYSFNKGFLLQGGVGVGKTTLADLFTSNPVRGYAVVETVAINKNYLKAGPGAISFTDKPHCFCLDDMGQESQHVKWMGNPDAVLEEVLSTRYRLMTRYPGKGALCHGTTNLPVLREEKYKGFDGVQPGEGNSLELHYGTRALDRFRQMFNRIEIPPTVKSFRS